MNTRLQVEHAVTERVVGIDLVKAQIEVAAGGYLPWRQRHITQTGHAIECRIYAEDPERDFMPCPGKIEGLRLPEGLGLRNDCGVYEGAEVPIYYDPMIAKLITWGENRVEAILRMRRALREYQVRGIKTNIAFNQWIVRHTRFMSGDFNTGFINEDYRVTDGEEVLPHKEIALASAAIAALHREQEQNLGLLAQGAAEPSKWRDQAKRNALRRQSRVRRVAVGTVLEGDHVGFVAKLGDQSYSVEIEEIGRSLYRVAVDGNEFLVDGKKTGRTNYSLSLIIVRSKSKWIIPRINTGCSWTGGITMSIWLTSVKYASAGLSQAGVARSATDFRPMPGKIIAVLVGGGRRGRKGQGLVIVEAMKMENEVRSPVTGAVREIKVKPGDTVEGGAVLLVVE
jgi:acetyl/propionyl-CoA carboxylase alpha subunit